MTIYLSDVNPMFLGVLGKHSRCGPWVSVVKVTADSLFHYLSRYSVNNERRV